MLKVLRKYRKWFLAVGGVLLMVTFLFSGTSSIFTPSPTKRAVATLGDEKVTMAESDAAGREFEALKSLAPNIVQLLGVENGTHWLLLKREAERAGLAGDEQDGFDWIPELARDETVTSIMGDPRMQGIASQLINNRQFMDPQIAEREEAMRAGRPVYANRSRLTPTEFDRTLAKLRGVARLENIYMQAPRLSDRRTIVTARRFIDAVLADVVVIPADRLVADAPAPTPEQLQAHFEKYRTVREGEGESGFGYVQPQRVKIEWMEIDRAAVAAAVALDAIAVSKRYQLNRATYPGEFAVERPKIENDLRQAKADEVLAQIDSVYKARVKSAVRRLETTAGIRTLTADWDASRPTMEALAADIAGAVREATGVNIPLPVVIVRGATWTRLDEVDSLPGIGSSQFRAGNMRGDFTQLVASVHEFAPESTLGFQARVPFEGYTVTTGDEGAAKRYYFTILDTRPEAPPETLDDVRDRVERGAKRLWAFEKLKAESPTYLATALADGPEAVGNLFARPAAGDTPAFDAIPVIKNVRISAMGSTDRRVPELDDQALRDEVMAMATALGSTNPPSAANLAGRTMVIPLPDSLAVAVVQITYPSPLTQEDLRLLGRDTVRQLLGNERRDIDPDFKNPFSFESMKERTGYREVRDETLPAPKS